MGSLCRWLYFVSVAALVFFALVGYTLVNQAHAARATYDSVRVGPGQYVGTGRYTSPITVNVNTPSAPPKYHQIKPILPGGSAAALAKKALRGGFAGAGIGLVIDGLGYLVDEAIEQGQTPLKKVVPIPGAPVGSWILASDKMSCSNLPADHSAYGQCSSECSSHQYCKTSSTNDRTSFTGWSCPVSHPHSSNAFPNQCFPEMTDPSEEIIDLDPSDWERVDDALANLPASTLNNLIQAAFANMGNPTGTVDFGPDNFPITLGTENSNLAELYDIWPELRMALQTLLNAEAAAHLARQDPNFQLTPEQQIIVDGGEFAPPPADISVDLELPGFCDWASFICAPFVPDDQPDLPTLDLEEPTFDSGLPNDGVCPEPVVFSIGIWGEKQVSFQPACDLAAAIRGPLIAIAYLMSGFIVVGVRR